MKQTCGTCGRAMRFYEGTGWVCTNIKAHDAISRALHKGGKRPGAGRKKKRK